MCEIPRFVTVVQEICITDIMSDGSLSDRKVEDQLLLPARDFRSTHLQLPFLSRCCSLLSLLSYDITYSVERASLNRLGSALNSRGIRIQFPAWQKDFSVFQIA
jgi:hypothetical protein